MPAAPARTGTSSPRAPTAASRRPTASTPGPTGACEFYVSQRHGTVYARSPDAGSGRVGRPVASGRRHLRRQHRPPLRGRRRRSDRAPPWSGSLEYLLPNSNDFYIGNYPGCSTALVPRRHRRRDGLEPGARPSDIRRRCCPRRPAGRPSPVTALRRREPGTGSGSGPTSGSGTPAGSGAGDGATKTKDATAVGLGLKLSTGTVNVDAHGHVASGGTTGLSITYTESLAAKLTVTLLRSETGERRGSRCVKPSGHARRLGTARTSSVISSVMHTDRAGHLTAAASTSCCTAS